MAIFLPLIAALALSAAMVPVCRVVAMRLGFVDTAHPSRRGRVTTRFGGVALSLAALTCAGALGLFAEMPALFSCAAALLVFGVASDAFHLNASTKAVALVAVASVFLAAGYRVYWFESVTLDSIATVFWIVGVTSAFNLLDNMDGLCCGIAVITAAAFLLMLLSGGPEGAALLRTQYLAVLIGALLGFLFYNVHPAMVEMGDSGSLVVGLAMAAVPLNLAPGTGSDVLSFVAVPVLVLLIPIADGALAAVSRIFGVHSSSASQAGGSSQRLVAIGLSERSAVLLLWALAAVGGIIGVIAGRTQEGLADVLAGTFIIAIALFAVYLARVKVQAHDDAERLPGTITPLGVEFVYRRRLAEVVLDLVLVALAYYGAHRLVYERAQFLYNFSFFVRSFPIVLATQMVALVAVGAYHGMWRYFSIADGVTVAAGVASGIIGSVAIIFTMYGLKGLSQNVFAVYGMLVLLLLVGSRASFRLLIEWSYRHRQIGRRLAIYGAGAAGTIAVRQLLNDDRNGYRIVGFVDDDPRKRNVRVHGYRIIGGYDHLVGMIMARELDAVTVTESIRDISALAWLCAKYDVALYRLNVDWQPITPAEGQVGREAALSLVATPGRDAMERREVSAPPMRIVAPAADVRAFPRAAVASGEPVRVAHVITRLILGGAQENTLYTAIGQHQDSRFDVTLVVGIDEAGEGNMFSEANRAGVNTVVIPSLIREIRPFTDIKAFFDLYRFFKRGSFTIVHTHSSKAGIIGRLAARAAGVPIVVHTLHGLVFHEFQSRWKNAIYIALKRVCAPLTDKIISVSDKVSQTALARGIGRPDQHVTIYSGIELDRFLSVGDRLSVEEAKRRVGIPPDAPVVGKIARLFPLKGHEQFLAAAVKIAREVPNVHFLLVGDGPLREQLQADAERLGLGGRVVMVGRVPPETVPDYIQAMDVVVHTSLREGIARVLPQAGAVGKPVVSFDLDGASEVARHGISGYLAPPVDIDAIARLTIELLRDPDLRRRFGDAGRAFAAEHFSVERMIERISGVYTELVARQRAIQRSY